MFEGIDSELVGWGIWGFEECGLIVVLCATD
jgi:hypothetical protein